MTKITKFIRVRDRNQITLPAEIIAGLPIHAGDFLEITRTENAIEIRPIRIIAVMGTPEAQAEVDSAIQDVEKEEYATFSSGREYADHLKRRRRSKSRAVARASLKAAGD